MTIAATVLVVGAGPVGLIQAYMLSQLGVSVIIIERHKRRLDAPKAHVVSSRSLEILRQFGIPSSDIRRYGTSREDAKYVRFVTNLSGEQVGVLPFFRLEPDVLDYTPEILHNIPQPDLEAIVRERLEKATNVTVQSGWTWISSQQAGKPYIERAYHQHGGNVTSVLENTYTGERIEMGSNLVIACDGANSRIRKSLGITSEIEDSPDTVMTIHFSADLRQVVKEKVGMLHWIMDPAVRGVIIAYDLGGNLVLLHNFNSEVEPLDSFTPERCRTIIRAAIGQDLPFDFLSALPWRVRRQVADSYHHGRIVLAGDAAHSFPPTGGFGLNTGIADAHNLAVKLAPLLRQGGNLSTALDCYQRERRPIALRNAWQSVFYGRKVFDLVKAFHTDNPDIAEASRAMQAALADEQQRRIIEQQVEEQRDQFNSINLDLGYVYESGYQAESATQYTAAYRKGARLPHVWINVINPRIQPSIPPVCLDYLGDDMPPRLKESRRYSILDLVPFDTYVFFGDQSQVDRLGKLEHGLRDRGIRVSSIVCGADFDFGSEPEDVSIGRAWSDGFGVGAGGIVVVRPDQHIGGVFSTQVSVEDAIKQVVVCQSGGQ